MNEYLPICFNNTKTYYSPCQIGCRTMQKKAGVRTFGDCAINMDTIYEISEGKCASKCEKIIQFIAITVLFVCCCAIIEVPTMNLIRE